MKRKCRAIDILTNLAKPSTSSAVLGSHRQSQPLPTYGNSSACIPLSTV
ncbi:hypothetical protein QUB63_09470 [Microcoleus sp. ARI1-B5]